MYFPALVLRRSTVFGGKGCCVLCLGAEIKPDFFPPSPPPPHANTITNTQSEAPNVFSLIFFNVNFSFCLLLTVLSLEPRRHVSVSFLLSPGQSERETESEKGRRKRERERALLTCLRLWWSQTRGRGGGRRGKRSIGAQT